MAPGCRHFERAFGGLLAFDVLQVGHGRIARIRHGFGPPQRLQAFEVVDELEQVGRREDRHVGRGPRRFRAARAGTDQPLTKRVCPDGCRERARDRGDGAVERQLAQHAIAFDGVRRHRADRSHHPERDREIVMAAFFR